MEGSLVIEFNYKIKKGQDNTADDDSGLINDTITIIWSGQFSQLRYSTF